MYYRLADIRRRHAEQRPDQVALALDDRTVTYAGLDVRSSRVAQALQAAGVGERDHVATRDLNSVEFFDVLFGAAKLGAVLAPVNFRRRPGPLRGLDRCGRTDRSRVRRRRRHRRHAALHVGDRMIDDVTLRYVRERRCSARSSTATANRGSRPPRSWSARSSPRHVTTWPRIEAAQRHGEAATFDAHRSPS